MPLFRWWLAAGLLRSVALALFGGVGRPAYFSIYAFTEPVLLALLSLAVQEAYREQARGYVDMGKAGQWLLRAGLGLAGLAALIVFATKTGLWPHSTLRAILLIRLTLIGFLAAFSICAVAVFSIWRAPASDPRHFRLLSLHLLVVSLSLATANWLGQAALAWINIAMLLAVALLWLGWLWLFWSPQAAWPSPAPAVSARLESGAREEAEAEAQALLNEVRRAAAQIRG